MPLDPFTIGAGLVSGAVKLITGNKKEQEAKAARDRLEVPFYDVQNEYYQNRNLANEAAQGGLPAATKDYYTDESQRGLSAGITGILGAGGNPNDISKLLETYDNGVAKIASSDAQTHLENIRNFMNVNKDLAGQKTTQWAINKLQPYKNNLQQINAAQIAGEATKWEGVGDFLNTAVAYGTSRENDKEMPDGNNSNSPSASISARLFGAGGAASEQAPQADNFGNTMNNAVNAETPENQALFQQYQQFLEFMQNKGKI